MSTLNVKKPLSILIAVLAVTFGFVLMSGLATAQPAHAKTCSGDPTDYPSNVKCGSYYQMIGYVGKWTAASCDQEGRAIVNTNMFGRGGKYNRHYYTWECVPVHVGNGYNLLAYWTQS